MSAKVHLHEKRGADVRLVVEVDENGHVGRYEFDVPIGPQTEAKIDAHVAKAVERHRVKARRYAEMAAVRAVRLKVDADAEFEETVNEPGASRWLAGRGEQNRGCQDSKPA